ncbi:hypothetical protein J4Q44_G00318580 [Coregonus suidteri]|uniref:Uncharacterized protein n=1 Tax=Coregonus suidteri TaxID=861788 RepID=A0AAN8QA66_9TELE
MGHLRECTEAPKPSSKPAAYGSELQHGGVPRQDVRSQSHLGGLGNYYLSSSFQQHNGRDHHEVSVSEATESEVKLDVSQGGTGNLSHITPKHFL